MTDLLSPDPTLRVTNINWGGRWVLFLAAHAVQTKGEITAGRFKGTWTANAFATLIADVPGRNEVIILNAKAPGGGFMHMDGPGKYAFSPVFPIDFNETFKSGDIDEGPLTIIARVPFEANATDHQLKLTGTHVVVSTMLRPTEANRLLTESLRIKISATSNSIYVRDRNAEVGFNVNAASEAGLSSFIIGAKNLYALPPFDPAHPKEPKQSDKAFGMQYNSTCVATPLVRNREFTAPGLMLIDTIKHKIIYQSEPIEADPP